MKKILIIAPVLFFSLLALAPSALAADCQQGYLQYSDGTYTNADGTACTPGANSGTPANASLFTNQNQSNPQSAGPSGFTALAPIPGLTSPETTSVVNAATLTNFFNNLYKYALGLAGILAVIEIIWGGLEISTKDSVSKQSDGKARITQAIMGLVLVLSPVLVFSIINPAILNLSVNLPALDTRTGAPTALVGSTNPGLGAALAAGCKQLNATSITGCPTQQVAYAFAGKCTNGVGEVIESAGNTWGVNCPQPGTQQFTDTSQVPSGQGLWCFSYNYYPTPTAVAQQRTICASSQTACVNQLNDPSQYVDAKSVISTCALKK